ncbi:MAG: AI-2E family transporter [Ruminococcus flavefaciens]|nr:AI-2E family transporter [Ruminococcus flavefaciens]MCM1229888.1 AI-2E family transporter [Ruminococcus flavefaciens]
MKINWNEKYNTISLYTILTFTVCILVYAVIFNFTIVGDIIRTVCSVTAPIIWGLIIAYLLNPIMMWTERQLGKIDKKKKIRPKLSRVISVIITMVIFLAMLSALCAIIIPQVTDSIQGIINNIGTYVNNFEKWISEILAKYPEILSKIYSQIENFETTIMDTVNRIAPEISDIMKKVTDSALSFIIAIKDFIIGIIVAIYFLMDKEHFQAQLKKIICALLPQRASSGFLRVCTQVNTSISGFVSGKIVDSIIIGCLCFICMTIMKLDFAVLISVLVGITNIIPFFGPFIGAIPSALLLLVSSPKQVIPFLILILVIQQLDGNIIGPKILGQSIGISAFWVLFSILVGGGLFGFAGMILGVPIFAVIYSLIDEYVTYRLENKNLPTATLDYVPEPLPDDKKPEIKKKSKNKKK